MYDLQIINITRYFFKFFDFSVWSQILIFWFWKFYFEKFEVKFHEKFGYREKVCHPCEKTKNFFELFSICFFWSNLKSTVVVFLDFFGRKTFFFTFLGEKYFSLLFWEKNHFSLLFWEKNNQTIIQSRSSGLHFARRQSA